MKKLVALLLAMTMVISMAACGTKEEASAPAEETKTEAAETTEETKEEAPAEDVVITWATRQNPTGEDAESAYTLEKVEEFNAMDNGITVELIWIPEEADYLNRLATDIAAGDCPNIFMEYGGSRVLDYVEADILVDMTPYYEADPEWYDSINPATWEPCVFDSYGYEGIYGIPWGSYQLVLIYNQALLDQAGVEVPTTWAEMMDACATLKAAGIQPWNLGMADPARFTHMLSCLAVTSYGVDTAKKIGSRELDYDSDETRALIDLLVEAEKEKYWGENIVSLKWSEERVYNGEGRCAFGFDLTSRLYWLEGSKELEAGNLHVTHMPAVNEEYYGYSQGGASQAYYISNQATPEEIEASVEFLKYITDVELVQGLQEVTKSTYAIMCPPSTASYIYEEAAQVISECKGLVAELQNYDSASGALTLLRNSLQTICMGASTDEVIETIMKGYEDME